MPNDTLVAVDLAKAEFDVVASTQVGKVDKGRRVKRTAFMELMAQYPQATVIMEACGSAHELGRKLQKLGHKVVLLPPHAVRPYVTRSKTDRADAKALLELSDAVRQRLGDAAVVLGTAVDGRVHLVANVAPALVERGVKAGNVVRAAAQVAGGGGGGRDTMAQAGGRDPEKLPEALATARAEIERALTA